MAKTAQKIRKPLHEPEREFNPVVKRGSLLTYVGEQMNDIFDILPNTGLDYDSAVKSFMGYFDPIRNKDMAIFDFRAKARRK